MPGPRSDDPEGRERLRKILRKVRKIEFLTRGKVAAELGGEYHSSFRGQGIDFDEFREYQPGDEVRAIDWNVTARTGKAHIKKFIEDRELTVVLAVDVSASAEYGSVEGSKRDLAAEVAALFAFSAIHNQDKVALLLFSDQVELFLPPRKGTGHCLRLVREILAWEATGRGTDAAPALDTLVRLIDRRSLVLLISDFQCEELEPSLRLAAVKHDVVAVQVSDPREAELADVGRITLEDPESGEQISVNTGRASVRTQYAERVVAWQSDLDQLCKKTGVDHLHLRTGEDTLPAVHAFFRRRSQGSLR